MCLFFVLFVQNKHRSSDKKLGYQVLPGTWYSIGFRLGFLFEKGVSTTLTSVRKVSISYSPKQLGQVSCRDISYEGANRVGRRTGYTSGYRPGGASEFRL